MISTITEILDSFRLDAKCVDARQYRHFASYDLSLGPKCQISKIQKLSGEIALKIKSKNIPIIKPIPEKGIVRLHVVTKDPEIIHLNNLLNRYKPEKGLLPCLFGETDNGEPLWVDLAQNPHMLVAGTSGSGKSVFLHCLISNLARTPNTTVMLADPKRVEFSSYAVPQLKDFIPMISNTYEQTIGMLEYLVQTMESRYDSLRRLKVRSIEQMRYPFDKVVVIIDEVADLILADKDHKFENLIIKLAQKSRAAGIYLVLATQRPSVNVLTGLIKANFEGRLSCKVSSKVDSGVILDRNGAENLLGRGDAIFKNAKHDYVRLQVAFTTPEETINLISSDQN